MIYLGGRGGLRADRQRASASARCSATWSPAALIGPFGPRPRARRRGDPALRRVRRGADAVRDRARARSRSASGRCAAPVFGGGALQTRGCAARCSALGSLAARAAAGAAALVAGLALALSSTAIAMQTMTERNLLATPIGRIGVRDPAVPGHRGDPADRARAAARGASSGRRRQSVAAARRKALARDRRRDRHRPLPDAPGAALGRQDGPARGVHRVRAAARARHRAADGARRRVDGARRVPRRRAARELGVPPRARDRHRAVQGPADGPVLHRGRHVDRLRPARRAARCDRAGCVLGLHRAQGRGAALRSRRRSAVPAQQRWLFAALLAQGGEFAFVVFGVARTARRPARRLGRAAHARRRAVDGAHARSCCSRTTAALAAVGSARGRRRRDRRRGRAGDHRGLRPLRADRRAPAVRERHPRDRARPRSGPDRAACASFGFRVFYGDATRLDLLDAAGAAQREGARRTPSTTSTTALRSSTPCASTSRSSRSSRARATSRTTASCARAASRWSSARRSRRRCAWVATRSRRSASSRTRRASGRCVPAPQPRRSRADGRGAARRAASGGGGPAGPRRTRDDAAPGPHPPRAGAGDRLGAVSGPTYAGAKSETGKGRPPGRPFPRRLRRYWIVICFDAAFCFFGRTSSSTPSLYFASAPAWSIS